MITLRWAVALLISFLILSPLVGATNVNPLYQDKGFSGTNPLYEGNNFSVAPGSGGGAGGSIDLAFVSGDNILAIPSGGSVITLTGSNFDRRAIGPISVGDGHVHTTGAIAGIAVGAVYAVPLSGGTPITIAGTFLTSSAPAISSGANPRIAYKAPDATGTENIYATTRTGGVPLTVRGVNFAQLGRPSINSFGDIAHVSTPVGSNEARVYVHSADGGFSGTIQSPVFLRLTTSQPKIIDNDKRTVSFTALDSATGSLGLYRSDGYTPTGEYHPPTLVSAGVAAGSPFSVAHSPGDGLVIWGSKKGYDYYQARSDLNAAGAGLEAITETRVIGAGDMIGGLTVSDVVVSESSQLPNGDAVLMLSFTDGSAGIYYVQVPEPTSVVALAGAAAWGLRRRR